MFSTLFARRKASDYIRQCRRAIRAGRPLPEPTNLEELTESLTEFPRQAARYRPSEFDRRRMGLPDGWPFQEVSR